MGLHITPYGTFYVQRSLRTGEVMQVLPVKRPDTPSRLPSVDSLGITETFIERRRASIAADNARASTSQDRLQQALASVGGERLLETGKAVLAQRDDGGSISSTTNNSRPTAPAAKHDGDFEMLLDHHTTNAASAPLSAATTTAAAGAAAAIATAVDPPQYAQWSEPRTSNTIAQHASSGEGARPDFQSPPPRSSLATAPHILPVRTWSGVVRRHSGQTVNLPPFHAIDSARALSLEAERRSNKDRKNRGHKGGRKRAVGSPRLRSLCGHSQSQDQSRSCSPGRSQSRSRSRSTSISTSTSTSGSISGSNSSSSSAVSIDSMISHGSGPSSLTSTSSVYSADSIGSPSVLAASPAASGCGITAQRASQGATSTHRRNSTHKDRPSFSPTSVVPKQPRSVASQSLPLPRKEKTVWIIRTLEPRKLSSTPGFTKMGSRANNDDDHSDTHGGYNDDQPQQVRTHVETHISS
ncbi:hypothetical protein SPI_04477 [Niveomyces insectorum RCEF 264]|uniref:Uncharacterized protein n=1 Tax=Niveomyces insectorum RCEF 264 TaxID=1081102 RepID=A0A167UIR1_9HYPO|nr:hypothetical protein SPI_04477 [Niveomyces insectorum RCEF 264]